MNSCSFLFVLLLLVAASSGAGVGDVCNRTTGYITDEGWYWNLATYNSGWSAVFGFYQYSVSPCTTTVGPLCGASAVCQWGDTATPIGYNFGWNVAGNSGNTLTIHYNGPSTECPSGQNRTTIVSYQCGISNPVAKPMVLSVTEGPECTYSLVVGVPTTQCYRLAGTTLPGTSATTVSPTVGSASSSGGTTGNFRYFQILPVNGFIASAATASYSVAGTTPLSLATGTGLWSAGARAPQWVQFDLQTPLVFSNASITLLQSATDFTTISISASTDNIAFQTLAEFHQTTSDGQKLTWAGADVLARYLRVDFLQSTVQVGLRNISLFGHCSEQSNALQYQCTSYTFTTTGPAPTPTPIPCSDTDYAPSINNALTYFANNTLFFTVQAPVSPSNAHAITDIKLGTCPSSALHIVQSTQGCTQRYSGYIAWPSASACGLNREDAVDRIIFHVPVLVTTVTTIVLGTGNGAVSYNHSQTDPLFVSVSFPSNISSSTPVEAIAPPTIYAGVTQQNYQPDQGKVSVQFVTQIAYPELLAQAPNPVVSVPDGILIANFHAASTGPYPGNPLQTWAFDIIPTWACTLNGAYVFNFTVTCNTGAVCNTNVSSTVTLNLQSSNLCAESQEGASVTSLLAPYGDSAYRVPIRYFLDNTVGYWLVTVNSPNSPISHLELSSVTSTRLSSPTVVIYSPANGINIDNAVTPLLSNTSAIGFSLLYSPTIFPTTFAYTIQATVQITFADNSKKRAVAEFAHNSASPSTVVHVTNSNDQEGRARNARSLEEPQPQASAAMRYESGRAIIAGALLLSLVSALFM